MKRYATSRPLPGPRDGAYIVAGSFTSYLIETYAFAKYRALYAETPKVPGERVRSSRRWWERIYGKSRDDLIAEWTGLVCGK